MKATIPVRFGLFLVILLNLVFFIAWKFSFNAAEIALHNAGYELPISDIPGSYISENQTKIDVLKYDIDIELFTQKEQIRGNVLVTGVILDRSIQQIDLNFYDNFNIEKILVNDKPSEYINEDMHLSIPVSGVKKDTFEIRVIYSGQPEKKGLSSFSFDTYKKRPVVYSLNEPVFASTWFPCNDKPDDKAQLEMKITNDSSSVSVSNGRLMGVTTEGSKKTYHWKTIYPISTYLICLYSAGYSHFSHSYISEEDTMNIDYFVFPEHREMAQVDFNEHTDYMKYFESVFGEYPFIKEKYGVAEFLWQMGAMEHQTITGIGSNFLNGKGMFNEFYIHELAHQWFGNAVGPGTWKDIWLNEGFASYSEALYSEYKYGFSSYKSVMQQKFQSEFAGTLYDPDYMFSSTVYDKGAWVVHMLRWELGDSTFFRTLKEYYQKFKYRTATTKDLLDLCSDISGKNLKHFFDQWVFKGSGIIKADYNVQYVPDGDEMNIRISISQVQDGYHLYRFPLEITLKNNNGQETYRNIFYIDKPEEIIKIKSTGDDKVILDPDNWLLAEFEYKKAVQE